MDDTLTISESEIEAVAAKLDAGETLDEYDRVILRGVFVLAGRSAAEAAEADADVSGFGMGGPTESLSLNFTKVLCDGSVRGGFSAGKVATHDFHFTVLVNKSTP